MLLRLQVQNRYHGKSESQKVNSSLLSGQLLRQTRDMGLISNILILKSLDELFLLFTGL